VGHVSLLLTTPTLVQLNVLKNATPRIRIERGQNGTSDSNSVPCEESPLIASAIASAFTTRILLAIIATVGGGGAVTTVGGIVVVAVAVVVAVTANSKLDVRSDVKKSPQRKQRESGPT